MSLLDELLKAQAMVEDLTRGDVSEIYLCALTWAALCRRLDIQPAAGQPSAFCGVRVHVRETVPFAYLIYLKDGQYRVAHIEDL